MNDELIARWNKISQELKFLTEQMEGLGKENGSYELLESLNKRMKILEAQYEDLIIDVNIEILFAQVEDQLIEEGYIKETYEKE